MVNIEGGNTVKESSGNRVVMSRNCEVVIVDENNRERSRNSIPYGSRILIDNKSINFQLENIKKANISFDKFKVKVNS